MINYLIKILKLLILPFFIISMFSNAFSKERFILCTTTSTFDSGLITYLNDNFEKKFDFNVHVISQSTGQVIINAEKGSCDILVIHHKKSEIKFMNSGFGIKNYNLMYNQFIIVGPKDDPAKIQSSKNLNDVMKKIMNTKSTFISRSDNSGTYFRELKLWNSASINVNSLGNWYKKIGQGMGATLNMANSLRAYTITDTGTWNSFQNKDNLKILFINNKELKNQYSIILVNNTQSKESNFLFANIYFDWILSKEGKELINSFKKNGKTLFLFNGNNYINN